MAIPCNGEHTEDIEENYRRLERLLYELYLVLRAILGNPAPTPAGAHSGGPQTSPPSDGSSDGGPSSGGPGPSNSSSGHPSTPNSHTSHSSRPRHGNASHVSFRRHRFPRWPPASQDNDLSCTDSAVKSDSISYWSKVGTELRLIADSMQQTRQHQTQRASIPVPLMHLKVNRPALANMLPSFSTLQLITSILRVVLGSGDGD